MVCLQGVIQPLLAKIWATSLIAPFGLKNYPKVYIILTDI
jgi:hypothetical protein